MDTDNEPIGSSDWWTQQGLDPKVEDGVVCEYVGCDEQSEGYFQVVCCKAVYMMCPYHMGKTLFMINVLSPNEASICKHCHTRITSLDFIMQPKHLRLDVDTDEEE